jgi:mRNA interferase HigB
LFNEGFVEACLVCIGGQIGLVVYLKLRFSLFVRIIARRTLNQIWGKRPQSQTALIRWFKIVQKTEFDRFAELRAVFPSADKLDHWIIFNIGGNKYRLITSIDFNRGKVYIRHVLTQAEYDRGDWQNNSCK